MGKKAEGGDLYVPKHTKITGEPASIERPETGTRLSAKEIHANILGSAEEELERSSLSLLFSAVAAGLTIGFSFLAGGWVRGFAQPAYQNLVVSLVYPLGFAFIIFARNELYTENTLEPVIPLLHKRDAATLADVARLWVLLIMGNLVGAFVFAAVIALTDAIPPSMRADLQSIATQSTSDGFGLTFYRAIFAGWLLALLTWLLASGHDRVAQLALIWLATVPIAAFEFRHSIVGAVEAFYRVFDGSAGWGDMVGNFILPAVLGNGVGGVSIVTLLNFGQVSSDSG
jgi:formate/nitrite transporter FocA (FNT family)